MAEAYKMEADKLKEYMGEEEKKQNRYTYTGGCDIPCGECSYRVRPTAVADRQEEFA